MFLRVFFLGQYWTADVPKNGFEKWSWLGEEDYFQVTSCPFLGTVITYQPSPLAFVPVAFYCLINPTDSFIKLSIQGTVPYLSIDYTRY